MRRRETLGDKLAEFWERLITSPRVVRFRARREARRAGLTHEGLLGRFTAWRMRTDHEQSKLRRAIRRLGEYLEEAGRFLPWARRGGERGREIDADCVTPQFDETVHSRTDELAKLAESLNDVETQLAALQETVAEINPVLESLRPAKKQG